MKTLKWFALAFLFAVAYALAAAVWALPLLLVGIWFSREGTLADWYLGLVVAMCAMSIWVLERPRGLWALHRHWFPPKPRPREQPQFVTGVSYSP